jgi:hypothetical protein
MPAVTNAAWIMRAASTRGQARYRFTVNYNGYCDGTTTAPAFPEAEAGSMRSVLEPQVQLRWCGISTAQKTE